MEAAVVDAVGTGSLRLAQSISLLLTGNCKGYQKEQQSDSKTAPYSQSVMRRVSDHEGGRFNGNMITLRVSRLNYRTLMHHVTDPQISNLSSLNTLVANKNDAFSRDNHSGGLLIMLPGSTKAAPGTELFPV